MNGSLIEIRLIYDDNKDTPWQDLPISAYMPLFLTGETAKANIAKRVQMTYFRYEPTLLHVCCCPKDFPKEVFWIERES
jgi:hypothetical protein